MNTKDIILRETGNGGDFVILNNDLLLGEVLYQQVYLALFGGNLEASTKQTYLDTEERFDYWGNSLIWSDNKSRQFNSETERLLQNIALNSTGRLSVIQAVKNDLAFLSNVVEIEVTASILSVNRLSIIISFLGKTNQQDKSLQLIYDNALNEVIIDEII